MTDRPIPFSGPMVRALLDGRKTQTRRVLKTQPPAGHELVGIYAPGLTAVFNPAGRDHRGKSDQDFSVRLPSLKDRLWVREAWRSDVVYDDLKPSAMSGEEPVKYEADHVWQTWGWCGRPMEGRFRAGMHVPRWASRLTLTVTDVRVQRVQEISAKDVEAEGALEYPPLGYCYGPHCPPDGCHLGCAGVREEFQDLWDSLNEKRGFGWEANPWVSAITFTVHRCNIDNMGLTDA